MRPTPGVRNPGTDEEIDGGSATVQADLYSFGKLAVTASAGKLVDHDAVPEIFSQAGVPKRLAKLLIDCTEPVPAKRPSELAPLLKELAAWQKAMRLWLTLMAPVVLVVLFVIYLYSLLAGLVLSLSIFILLAKCWETLTHIIVLVREQTRYRAAAEVVIDPEPTEIKRLSWWSLRKAGFDWIKPVDALSDPEGNMNGKPWRMLRKGTITVPVIRRHRGSSDWGPQHEVRVAAYCDLIEKCTGGEAPFGVILFAGTSDCVIIPNTNARQAVYDRAFKDVIKFLEIQASGTHILVAPTDRRCTGCPHGKSRQFQRGKSETVSNGKPLPAYTTNSVRASDGQPRGTFHCDCGDRFKLVPPHNDAIGLGVSREG